MSLDVVRGRTDNIVATKELVRILEANQLEKTDETLYLGYPLSANSDSAVILDALLISERYGLIAFIFAKSEEPDSLVEEQGELFFQLTNTLTQYSSLRKGRSLAIEPQVISIVPKEEELSETEPGYVFSDFDNLINKLSNLKPFDSGYYRVLVESLQRIAGIKPKKKRENVKKAGSKGDIIKKIEKEIANLDQWQKKAALEIVDGPQRIRGLAGSGKTIVLALKAAYLHSINPEWDIVITYYTRSLWQQYRDLITKFVYEFSKDDPNWNKLHLFHAWGSQSEQGLYSEIARSLNQIPANYTNAKLKFGRNLAFSGICNELYQLIPEDYEPLYDLLLIDEAQDMPAAFFQIAYKCTKHPKRLVWAYDELQNLNASVMPTIEDMFGFDSTGKPLIDLKNEPDEPMQDIVLPICYRNPPWILSLAHSLGFGIYRSQLVQHFETLGLWKDIGYKIDRGTLSYGKKVVLSRSLDSTPNYFFELLDPKDVIWTKSFDDADSQYSWIAQQIKKNIIEEELDPDDILVIFPSTVYAKSQYRAFAHHLIQQSIPSVLVGVTNERDIFRVSGNVSCSTIYRAKGNEAPMVYIVNADSCYEGLELIKLRNILFTAITRSRAWVRICGVGSSMGKLIGEIERFIGKNYTLDFKIPSEAEMKRLRTINKDRSQSDTKRIEEAQKGMRVFLDLINEGELDVSQIPEFNSLIKLYLSQSGGDNLDQKDE